MRCHRWFSKPQRHCITSVLSVLDYSTLTGKGITVSQQNTQGEFQASWPQTQLNFRHGLPEPCTKPAYAMVLARGHGLLTKQAYLSGFSLLQSAEFPCCLLALENINWPTAANWITVGYIVVVNRCLIELRCLTKKTPGIRCLSYIQTYTHQRKCHIPLSNEPQKAV